MSHNIHQTGFFYKRQVREKVSLIMDLTDDLGHRRAIEAFTNEFMNHLRTVTCQHHRLIDQMDERPKFRKTSPGLGHPSIPTWRRGAIRPSSDLTGMVAENTTPKSSTNVISAAPCGQEASQAEIDSYRCQLKADGSIGTAARGKLTVTCIRSMQGSLARHGADIVR